MKAQPKLGIQLYTLGDEVRNDFDATLRHLAHIGYREIELPHFFDLTPDVIARAVSAAGLVCPSFHVALTTGRPGMPTLNHLDLVMKAARSLGATNIVVSLFPFPERLLRPKQEGESRLDFVVDIARQMTAADWNRIAEQLNEKASLLETEGLHLAYHNHNVEFLRLPNGDTPLDLLLAGTDPALVDLELDVGWVAAAGLDAVAIAERYGRRIRQVHMKDLKPTEPNTALRLNPADVGSGIVDWERLVPALKWAGVEHFYVEQEAPFVGPRIHAARAAIDFLRPILL